MFKEPAPAFERASSDALETETMLPEIEAAESFEDLFAALDALGEIKGSRKVYAAAELKNRTQAAREVKVLLNQVTRAGGLRAKVEELIEKEGKE